jgi:iron complex transport system substrate-binding protein
VRIVSLLPSATEIVCTLGARDQLVGRSHECDYPFGVEELPVLTSARVGPLPSSKAIDSAVRDVLKDALAIYEIDVERPTSFAIPPVPEPGRTGSANGEYENRLRRDLG